MSEEGTISEEELEEGTISEEELEENENIVDNVLVKREFDRYKLLEGTDLAKKERDMNVDIQVLNERTLALTRSQCSSGVVNSIRSKEIKLSRSKLAETAWSQFDDISAMEAVLCTSETFFFSNNSAVSVVEKVRNFIDSIRLVGSGSEGYTFKAKIAKGEYPFVVKYPNDGDNKFLVHEYIVGIFGLNKLRAKIPNFAYIFGMFRCSSPLIVGSKTPKTWCTQERGSEYVVYEHIHPATTMTDFMRGGATFDEWLNAFMQILYALNYAHKEVDFTHYDLISTNVMIRNPGRGKFSIEYETERGTEYLESDFIATIIDYGFSHIKYKGRHYGIHGYARYGIFPDGSHPLHDAYKLFMNSAFHLSKYKREMERIHAFFNSSNTLADALEFQKKYLYYLPYTESSERTSLMDLAGYIRSEFDVNFIRRKPRDEAPVLGCNGKRVCKTLRGYLDSFFDMKPTDAFLMYDAVNEFTSRGEEEKVAELKREFDYVVSMNKAINEFNELSDKVFSTRLSKPIIKGMSLREVKSATKAYRKFVSKTLDYYDLKVRLETIEKVITFLSKLYNDKRTTKNVRESYKEIADESLDPEDALAEIKSDRTFVISMADNLVIKDESNEILWWKYSLEYILDSLNF